MVSAMKDLERTWNHKFNYPWMFFNDEPFTEDFKQKTQAVTKAKCYYGTVDFWRLGIVLELTKDSRTYTS